MKPWKRVVLSVIGIAPYILVVTFVKEPVEEEKCQVDSTQRVSLENQKEALDFYREELSDSEYDSIHSLQVERDLETLRKELKERQKKTFSSIEKMKRRKPYKKQ